MLEEIENCKITTEIFKNADLFKILYLKFITELFDISNKYNKDVITNPLKKYGPFFYCLFLSFLQNGKILGSKIRNIN